MVKRTGGFLDRSRETRPWEERQAELGRRLAETVRRAHARSRAYRERFDAAGVDPSRVRGVEDLPKLPILRLAELVERQKRDTPYGGFETVGPEGFRRIYANPGLIWQPGEWEYRDTSWAEGLCGAGFARHDRILNTFNYHLWPFAHMLDDSARMIGATVIPTGVGNTFMQVKILQALQVSGYMGTPSFLMTLLQRAESAGLDPKQDLTLERAFVAAEMLPESLRRRLEERSGIRVRQAYGTVLLGCAGYECELARGLHVPDNVLVEVVDPQANRPLPAGATGEVVVTSFSETYPMIRMATGDLSAFSAEPCPCGRTGPLLTKIMGRIDQASKVRGTFIHPWQTDEVISRHPEVFRYQVVITRRDHSDVMTFRIELREGARRPEILRARIARDIKDLLTIKGEVEVLPPGTLPDLHRKIEDRRSWD